jgi:ABC-type Co2+ transport system permease subunit/energy-coupling factor transporter transmembrane protein EcfT
MRIPDGYLASEVIIISWIFSFILVLVITTNTSNVSTKQLTQVSVFTAFQFFLQIVAIPIVGLPIAISLSGVVLSLLVLGMRLGLLSSMGAILLASILIPGYLSTLGVNSFNIIIAGFGGVFIPRTIINTKELKGRKKVTFGVVTTILYQIVHTVVIVLEFNISHTVIPPQLIGTFIFIVLGITLFESILTGVIYSYLVEHDHEKPIGKTSDFDEPYGFLDVTEITETQLNRVREALYSTNKYSWNSLDPRSKLLITGILILAVATSSKLYQLIFYAGILFVLYFLYRPRSRFIIRILIIIPIGLLIVGLFVLTLGPENAELGWLIGLRIMISVSHSSMLLESEKSLSVYIESLGSLGVPKILVTVLLIAYRLATRLVQDYNKISASAKGRAFQLSFYDNIKVKEWIKHYVLFYRIVLLRSIGYSDKYVESLTSRGFTGSFDVNIIPYTKLGLLTMSIVALMTIANMILPYYIAFYN